MKVVIGEIAEADIERQYRWYLVHEEKYELAERFRKAVTQTIHKLAQAPMMGSPKPTRSGAARSWPVSGFEQTRIYYAVAADGRIHILRVLHGKRNLRKMM